MSVGTGIAVAGMWMSLAAIILGYTKWSEQSEFSPLGVLILVVVAAVATANIH